MPWGCAHSPCSVFALSRWPPSCRPALASRDQQAPGGLGGTAPPSREVREPGTGRRANRSERQDSTRTLATHRESRRRATCDGPIPTTHAPCNRQNCLPSSPDVNPVLPNPEESRPACPHGTQPCGASGVRWTLGDLVGRGGTAVVATVDNDDGQAGVARTRGRALVAPATFIRPPWAFSVASAQAPG